MLKADGLAAGKGVLVTENRQEALDWIDDVMENSKFGDAGQKILYRRMPIWDGVKLYGHYDA